MSKTLRLLQTSSSKVQIYLQSEVINNQMFLLENKDNIKGLDCMDNFMLIWSSRKIEVREIQINPEGASTKTMANI
jgi:hypothetical protein